MLDDLPFRPLERIIPGTLSVVPESSLTSSPVPKDAHRTLGLWSIRRALIVSVIASIMLLISSWLFISWFLGSPPRADPKPLDVAAQLDLLKLVFAAVAGVGALVALVTAYRRQRLDEIASERAERVQAHSEKVADANIHDATERRVTELYSHAVEQLGHEKAMVRLGGLYSLERLAQQNPEHRQVVTEVICAYLRMPYGPLSEVAGANPGASSLDSDARQEWQVRRAAQEILAKHLRKAPPGSRLQKDPPDPPDEWAAYWPGVTLNLRSAALLEVDFSECHFTACEFGEARFVGQERFSGSVFHCTARFAHAKFEDGAAFDGVDFFGHLSSHGAKYGGVADFRNSEFHRQFHLAREEFTDQAWFTDSVFHADARFVNPASPRRDPRFHAGIDLSGARVLNTSEVVMLPPGWATEEEEGNAGRSIVSEGGDQFRGTRGNYRPPYPRQGQRPDPRWAS
ncbi:pentapeptide repeat-containing protein [Streptomyces sp. NPDC018019]|uniref:pentapeptide repeat-containing protein n=1 Tax=Streptomyces sp. NPDC018019 TaxID=3365030 RepID=UPI0037ACDF0E